MRRFTIGSRTSTDFAVEAENQAPRDRVSCSRVWRALPSVVGGRGVIAVPTSVGYGANFGGISALLGMLTSASGVTVVNIDNGFGAAAAANRILRATLASALP